MRVVLIYQNKLRIGDFRLSRWKEPQPEGFQSLINFTEYDSIDIIVVRDPILSDIDMDSMTFIDPDTHETLVVIPYDHVEESYLLQHSIKLREPLVEPPRPPEFEGDPNCNHTFVDDGDNLQIICTKCGKRSDISLSIESVLDLLDSDPIVWSDDELTELRKPVSSED